MDKQTMNDAPSDDSELLRRFAADRSDEQAFAAFVERRIGFVYGAALRRTAGDAHLAEDITQTVFLVASQKTPALARHAHVTGWLHTATRHIALTALRDARLRREREHEAAAMSELLNDNRISDSAAAASESQQHMREVLDEAIDALAPKDREAVLLRFFEGRDFAEIGARMKTNEAAARMRVSRALDKLRVVYARRGVTSTAAALGALMSAEAAAAAPAGLASSVTGAILAASGATAAAAATTTVTAGVLAFMTSTKIAIIATAVALFVGTLAVLEARREKAVAAELVAFKREHTALLKNLSDTQKSAKKTQTSLEDLRRRKAEAAELAKNPSDPVTAGKAFLAEHPEIQAMLVDVQKAKTAGIFHGLYKELNLTPEQIDEFEDAFAKSGRMGGEPVDKDIPGIGKIALTTLPALIPRAETVEKFNEVFGPEYVDKLNTYMIAADSKELAYNLYYTDTPLTADQGARLTQVYLAAVAAARKAGDVNDTLYYWNEVVEQSSAILSAPQMSVLKQMLVEEGRWKPSGRQAKPANKPPQVPTRRNPNDIQ